MRLIMFGISSPNTMRRVDSPATFAAWMKSRFFSVSAWPRRMRASNAQSVHAITRVIVSMPRVCRNAVTSTRSGIVGMTKNTLVMRFSRSSAMPPMYPAKTPKRVASAVATRPASTPSARERRAPQTT